jgi:hypothetical protein
MMVDQHFRIIVATLSFYVICTAETNSFDDKFLRFSVKKALDQRLSPLGQFLVKVSRFASNPNVQSEVRVLFNTQ